MAYSVVEDGKESEPLKVFVDGQKAERFRQWLLANHFDKPVTESHTAEINRGYQAGAQAQADRVKALEDALRDREVVEHTNARLIAAAPDLADALETLVKISASEYSCDYVTDPGIHIDPDEWRDCIKQAREALRKAGRS